MISQARLKSSLHTARNKHPAGQGPSEALSGGYQGLLGSWTEACVYSRQHPPSCSCRDEAGLMHRYSEGYTAPEQLCNQDGVGDLVPSVPPSSPPSPGREETLQPSDTGSLEVAFSPSAWLVWRVLPTKNKGAPIWDTENPQGQVDGDRTELRRSWSGWK